MHTRTKCPDLQHLLAEHLTATMIDHFESKTVDSCLYSIPTFSGDKISLGNNVTAGREEKRRILVNTAPNTWIR